MQLLSDHYVQLSIPCKGDLKHSQRAKTFGSVWKQALNAIFIGQRNICLGYTEFLHSTEQIWFQPQELLYGVCPDIEGVGGNAERIRETVHKALKKVGAIID